jgi:energy-coupling factor transporter ATP-binding protein EcfA2
MHELAREGRAGPIAFEIVARSLDRRFRLLTADRMIADALGYLACAPEIAGPPPRDVIIEVQAYRSRLRIVEDGDPIREVLNAQAAVEYLHMRLYKYSMDERPRAAILHAGSLRRNGRRLLLVGTSGAGKSTLTLQLVHAGYEIEGDEHVFIDSHEIVARPRACRIKEASLSYLPESMVGRIVASPCYLDYSGERVFNVDPRSLGCDWRIDSGAPDFIFVLQRNHGGYSSARALPTLSLLQSLMSETGWRAHGRGRPAATLARFVGGARAFDLSLGELRSAIRCIESALIE